mmetsp:Transcript_5271/g.10841  ORF Transcript_5271/g.10841 Transcript_5271/m.10841 type:complete len:379 (+) Transcript_5271:250-1386(+)|eukprot:CAMPEP_0168732958 /NCGR_PEP_ID=MMETSP0724-20121128/8035_1 /TAXON_ID=265536 /ORGANISM="Amphiprora sp., Strain CCMP467" /LENGTH=378 /DNA_ID=CAMNT_0008779985 /DNA_START=187 /DNA_END=1323 /DNA_ORIENTATION=+
MKAKSPSASHMLLLPPQPAPAPPPMNMRDDVSVSSTFTRERPSFVKQQKAARIEHPQQRTRRGEDTDATVLPPQQHHHQPQLLLVDQQQQQTVLEPEQQSQQAHLIEPDTIEEQQPPQHYAIEPPPLTPLCPAHAAARVTFDLECNTHHGDGWQYSESEMVERWYGPEDYKKFKSSVISIVKAVMKAQLKRQQHQQKKSRDGAASTVFTYSAVLERTYNACFQMEDEEEEEDPDYPLTTSTTIATPTTSILSQQERHELRRCYKTTLDAECVLGLERLLVTRIGKDRSELRGSLFGIIVDLQHTPWPHWQVLSQNIAQISREVSRPARLFAQQLALAQAQAPCKDDAVVSGVPRKSKSCSSAVPPKKKAPQQERRFSN